MFSQLLRRQDEHIGAEHTEQQKLLGKAGWYLHGVITTGTVHAD